MQRRKAQCRTHRKIKCHFCFVRLFPPSREETSVHVQMVAGRISDMEFLEIPYGSHPLTYLPSLWLHTIHELRDMNQHGHIPVSHSLQLVLCPPPRTFAKLQARNGLPARGFLFCIQLQQLRLGSELLPRGLLFPLLSLHPKPHLGSLRPGNKSWKEELP